MNDDASSQLFAALVKAQAGAKALETDSANSFHGYKYVSAEAIITEARSALNANGLAVVCFGWRYDNDSLVSRLAAPDDGDVVFPVSAAFMLIHSSGGTQTYEVNYPCVPERGRPPDKAVATALTHATAYFLRGLLCLPRLQSSDDVDQRDDTKYQPGRGRQKAKPAAKPATKPAGEVIGDADAAKLQARAEKAGVDRLAFEDWAASTPAVANLVLNVDTGEILPLSEWPRSIGRMVQDWIKSKEKPSPAKPEAKAPSPSKADATTPEYWWSRLLDAVKASGAATDQKSIEFIAMLMDDDDRYKSITNNADRWKAIVADIRGGKIHPEDFRTTEPETEAFFEEGADDSLPF